MEVSYGSCLRSVHSNAVSCVSVTSHTSELLCAQMRSLPERQPLLSDPACHTCVRQFAGRPYNRKLGNRGSTSLKPYNPKTYNRTTYNLNPTTLNPTTLEPTTLNTTTLNPKDYNPKSSNPKSYNPKPCNSEPDYPKPRNPKPCNLHGLVACNALSHLQHWENILTATLQPAA